MSKDLKSSVAIVVRAARQRLGLTQEDLAARVERTPESISNIERGLQLPNIETLLDLSEILGVPIADFFEGHARKTKVSLKRTKLEAQFREIARELSDRDLGIAVRQATAFLEPK